MVKKVDGWTAVIVRRCLEGIGELDEDHFNIWLEADVRPTLSLFSLSHTSDFHFYLAEAPTDDLYPHVYVQSINRFACALGSKAVLPLAFQCIFSMLTRLAAEARWDHGHRYYSSKAYILSFGFSAGNFT
jgi:hypothetical protein